MYVGLLRVGSDGCFSNGGHISNTCSHVDASNATVVHGGALHLLGVGDLDWEASAFASLWGAVEVLQEPAHVLASSLG